VTPFTNDTAAFETYALALGKVIARFHALEICLRKFLQAQEISLNANKVWVQIKPEPVDQTVPLDSYSTYETLNNLIKRYNALVTAKSHTELTIDLSIIELRDALAHGRMWSQTGGGLPLQLLKFSKPVQGSVRLTVLASDLLDESWLAAQATRVATETAKVVTAGAALYPANGNQR
jgi:hypothetical protein